MYNRIILHWTAGLYLPSEYDKEHYHAVIGFHRGFNAMVSKKSPFDLYQEGEHAWHDNTGAYGISAASMAGSGSSSGWEIAIRKMLKDGTLRKEFDKHNFGFTTPIRWAQIELMAKTCAEFLHALKLPCNDQTCYTHAESAARLGYFPDRWDLWLLGEKIRNMVNWYMKEIK